MKRNHPKAEELMLGDFLYDDESRPHTVKSLGEGTIDGLPEGRYSRIPLTDDFFRRSGWKHSLVDSDSWYPEVDGAMVSVIRKSCFEAIPCCLFDNEQYARLVDEMESVDELQRALRILGYGRLLKGLKVE